MSASKRLLNELDSGSRAGNDGPVRQHHLLRMMATAANNAGMSSDARGWYPLSFSSYLHLSEDDYDVLMLG